MPTRSLPEARRGTVRANIAVFSALVSFYREAVAPHAAAWIETVMQFRWDRPISSPVTQGRGSKHGSTRQSRIDAASAANLRPRIVADHLGGGLSAKIRDPKIFLISEA
ncbi:hypothetical protein CKO32_14745 [Afifella marina DSM 2698]|nr:hypothetical protein [Afifella marina DSM 2698]MBK1628414.1 hypothetical protein [Afifella marina]MBK5917901.1 hypothetical protein [Afifella marina]RAI18758.1 hypothetical protein CH311_14915 [Afifella marina DSM 2698]